MNTTIRAIISTPIISRKPICRTSSCPQICVAKPGKAATMPAKIISDMPLPMPRSVINSPSQTRNIVPAVIEIMAAVVGSRASPAKPTLVSTPLCCNSTSCPNPWAKAIGTVIQWTMRLTLARPASPSRDICCNWGMTGVSSCITMDAVM